MPNKPTVSAGDVKAIYECMELTVKVWNKFLEIENKHPLDESEMCRDIHDIQNRLFSLANKNGHIIKGQS